MLRPIALRALGVVASALLAISCQHSFTIDPDAPPPRAPTPAPEKPVNQTQNDPLGPRPDLAAPRPFEPTPPENPILKLDNVIVTPHAAGFSDDAVREGQRMGAREMASLLTGTFPVNICNPEVRGRTRFPFTE